MKKALMLPMVAILKYSGSNKLGLKVHQFDATQRADSTDELRQQAAISTVVAGSNPVQTQPGARP